MCSGTHREEFVGEASSELLTHEVQGALQLLEDHMSSSKRNQKHLKETFAMFAAAIAEAGRGGAGQGG